MRNKEKLTKIVIKISLVVSSFNLFLLPLLINKIFLKNNFVPIEKKLFFITSFIFWSLIYILQDYKKFLESYEIKNKIDKLTSYLLNYIILISYILYFVSNKYKILFINLHEINKLEFTIYYILLILCLIFRFIVFKTNKYSYIFIQVKKEQNIIDYGVYRIIRHPSSLSLIIFYIINILIFDVNLIILIFKLFGILLVIYRTEKEDIYLRKNLDNYNNYCKHVKFKYLPYII